MHCISPFKLGISIQLQIFPTRGISCKISFCNSLLETLWDSWKQANIVNLLGKTNHLFALKDRTKELWELREIGLWMLSDHYLAAKLCVPNFITFCMDLFPMLGDGILWRECYFALTIVVWKAMKNDISIDEPRGMIARVRVEISLKRLVFGRARFCYHRGRLLMQTLTLVMKKERV